MLTAMIMCIFPIVVNVATGLATTEPELEDVMRSLRATKLDILWNVGLPRTMPYFFASLKVAVTLAFVGTVISETVASNRGIGNVMMIASSNFDVPLVFAGLLILAALGVALYAIFSLIESTSPAGPIARTTLRSAEGSRPRRAAGALPRRSSLAARQRRRRQLAERALIILGEMAEIGEAAGERDGGDRGTRVAEQQPRPPLLERDLFGKADRRVAARFLERLENALALVFVIAARRSIVIGSFQFASMYSSMRLTCHGADSPGRPRAGRFNYAG